MFGSRYPRTPVMQHSRTDFFFLFLFLSSFTIVSSLLMEQSGELLKQYDVLKCVRVASEGQGERMGEGTVTLHIGCPQLD